MENTPFLGLDGEVALENGPNSDAATEHDTRKKNLQDSLKSRFQTSNHSFIPLNVQFFYPLTHS